MKKFFKYTLLALLLLAVAFFSIGLIKPDFTYETRIHINSPSDSSFADFTNSMKILEWIPGLEGISWISGDQNVPGSKWLFIIKVRGTKYEMIQSLNTFKPGQEFSFTTQCEMFTSDVVVRFVPQGTGTELVATSHMKGKNLFWRSGLFIGQSFLKDQDRLMYEKFKEVAEK